MNERRAFWAVATPAVLIVLLLRNGGLELPDFSAWNPGKPPSAPSIDKPEGADDFRWVAEPFAGHEADAKVYAGVFAALAKYLRDDKASAEPLVTTMREFSGVLVQILDGVPAATPSDFSAAHKRLADHFAQLGTGLELLSDGGRFDSIQRSLAALSWVLQNEVD